MTPEQLLESFKTQQSQIMEEIRKLDSDLAQRKELFVKLQGAIEGISLLNPEIAENLTQSEQTESVELPSEPTETNV